MRRLALFLSKLTLTLTLHIDTEMKVDFRSCLCLLAAPKDDHVYYGVLTDWTVRILGKRTDVDMSKY